MRIRACYAEIENSKDYLKTGKKNARYQLLNITL